MTDRSDGDISSPVEYAFDTAQGIWVVTCGEDHFYSAGLDRAKTHAEAAFGAAVRPERITVDATFDALRDVAIERCTAAARDARLEAVRYVRAHEIPLGANDLGALLEATPEEIRELIALKSLRP